MKNNVDLDRRLLCYVCIGSNTLPILDTGHVLGLEHSSFQDAIMYPSLNAREVKVMLAQDDIDGAQAIYGVNPTYNPIELPPGVPLGLIDRGAKIPTPC